MVLNTPTQYKKCWIDMQLNDWSFLDFSLSSSQKIIKAFDSFYHLNSRFPADYYLISVPKGIIPDFIQTNNEISPLFLYERLRGGKCCGLVCTQFLCALNIQLGSNPDLTKVATSELYHNLSLQALSQYNHEILLNFSLTTDLVMNINQILQDKTNSFKRIEQETKQNELAIFKNEIFLRKTMMSQIF